MENSFDGLMEQQHRMKRPVALPWILFAVALVAGAAISLHLALRLRDVRSDAAAVAAKAHASDDDLRQQLDRQRAASADLDARLQKLERQSAELLALKADLELKARTPPPPPAKPARPRAELASAARAKSSPDLGKSKHGPARKVAKKQDRG
jgi:hypothetical protein